MSEKADGKVSFSMLREVWIRRGLMLGMFAAFVGTALFFHRVLKTDILFTHFAYVPIVLACVWWGKRGIWMAVLLAGSMLAISLFDLGSSPIWDDLIRSIFLIVIAFVVSSLSERAKRISLALASSEEKYRNVVEKSLTAVLVYQNDRVIFANQRLGHFLNLPFDQLIGRSIWEIFHRDDLPDIRERVYRRKKGDASDLHYECRLVRQDHSILWAEILSAEIQYDGHPAVLANIYDITPRKEAETRRLELLELAQKQEEQLVHSARLAEMGEMAAAVAHELNQPLTGIRNFARNAFYMIENQVGTEEEIQDNLRLISQQVDRASKIINQMRELTRKSDLKLHPLDLNPLIEETVEFLAPQFRLSGISANLSLVEDPPLVLGDRTRLEQVLLNLMTNARQAMEDSDRRKLQVETRIEPSTERPLIVEIQDTGCGFDSSSVEKLFTPFYSTKEAGRGTGLGLSISLRIIEEHGGTIHASSQKGEGSRFVIRLPTCQEEDKKEQSNDAGSETNETSADRS